MLFANVSFLVASVWSCAKCWWAKSFSNVLPACKRWGIDEVLFSKEGSGFGYSLVALYRDLLHRQWSRQCHFPLLVIMHHETLAPWDTGLPGYYAPIKIVPLAVQDVQVLLLACRDRVIVLLFLGWSGLGPTIILGVLQTCSHLQISKITVDLHVLLIFSAQIKSSRYSSILLY